MNSKEKVIMIGLLLIIFVNITPLQAELVLKNSGTLISRASEPPNVDGTIGEQEWNVSDSLDITLYGRENDDYTLKITLRSVYDPELENLFLAVSIPQARIGPLNYIKMYFHTNKSAPFLDLVNSHLTAGINNDIKEIYFNSNSSNDCHTYGNEMVVDYDHVNNNYGRCHDAGNTLTAEMRFPLNSRDREGGDVCLLLGQEIDFYIFYMNDRYDNESLAYYQFNRDTRECDICTLKIDGKIDVTALKIIITIPFIILGTSALSLIKKKK